MERKIEDIRRVVMGEPEPKKSVFTHTDKIAAMWAAGGAHWRPIWGWDEPPTLPHSDTAAPSGQSFFPPVGGVRIAGIHFADSRSPETDAERAEERIFWDRNAAEPSGWYEDPIDPMMHRTDTLDIGVVVAGEVFAVASDGTEELLREGDVYIQNGALHSWRANPEKPGHMVFVMLGLERDPKQ